MAFRRALARDIHRPDVAALELHLSALWSALVDTWGLNAQSTGNPRKLAETVALSSGRCIRADEALDLYVNTLARECDRFEYLLTGKDLF